MLYLGQGRGIWVCLGCKLGTDHFITTGAYSVDDHWRHEVRTLHVLFIRIVDVKDILVLFTDFEACPW